jgi:hypothetical protein
MCSKKRFRARLASWALIHWLSRQLHTVCMAKAKKFMVANSMARFCLGGGVEAGHRLCQIVAELGCKRGLSSECRLNPSIVSTWPRSLQCTNIEAEAVADHWFEARNRN